jgi:valyl-tRNA synthetase
MQPQLAQKIAEATTKEFPNGIASFGVDALRWTFASLASTGRDVKMDMLRLEGYRNFCNKIYNAGLFVLSNLENYQKPSKIELSIIDEWILSIIETKACEVHNHLSNYRFDLAANTLYELIWDEFCAWYLELAKPHLWLEDGNILKINTQHTLLTAFDRILRLAHPFIPFITEEFWQEIKVLAGYELDTIMVAPYPIQEFTAMDEEVTQIAWLKQFMLGIRQIRAENNIAPSKQLSVLLYQTTATDLQNLKNFEFYLKKFKLESITVTQNKPDACAIALVGDMQVLVPLQGLIDVKAEVDRITKELAKQESLRDKTSAKLSNQNFTAKAPAEVLEKERAKLNDIVALIEALKEQAQKLNALK